MGERAVLTAVGAEREVANAARRSAASGKQVGLLATRTSRHVFASIRCACRLRVGLSPWLRMTTSPDL